MFKNWIAVIQNVLVAAILMAGAADAAWLANEYGPLTIFPDKDYDCIISESLNFINAPTGYNYEYLTTWYASGADIGVANVLNMVQPVATGNYPVRAEFYHSSWPAEFGYAMGIAVANLNGPYITSVAICLNLTSDTATGPFSYNSTIATDKRDLSAIIAHEFGHSIGLGHDGTDLMNGAIRFGDNCKFQSSHNIEVGAHYTTQLRSSCLAGSSPAYFGDVVCKYESGLGVVLGIETLLESGVQRMIVSRAEIPGVESAYVDVGSFDLTHPNGGRYEFVDSGGGFGDYYMLECVGQDAVVHNSAVIRDPEGWNSAALDFAESVIDAMNSYNYSKVKSWKWRAVMDGQVALRAVTAMPERACDFLVVAYDEFAKSVAPICDYWEFMGYDVELVSCDGSVNGAEAVRACIAAYANIHPLEAVWLVGSTVPSPEYPVAPFVDLVPTFPDLHDFAYADLNGDALMDFPVGRLPARAEREAIYYVNKELMYHWETTWGGRKDPGKYSMTQLNIVADNRVCDCEIPTYDANEAAVGATGSALYDILSSRLGESRISGFLPTSDLATVYTAADNAAYHAAVRDRLVGDLDEGRHVVFGVSEHNSYADLYGCVTGQDWQQQGAYVPGTPGGRACETFWFTPECYATSYACNPRGEYDEPINSRNVSVFELFLNRGMLIFGSSQAAWHEVSNDVITKIAARVYEEDYDLGHARSIGSIWKEVFNEMIMERGPMPIGLSDYCILGDPMLFVRGVYDAGSGTQSEAPVPQLDVLIGPNPFNGRVSFVIGGLRGIGGSVGIFDLRGQLIRTIALPELQERHNLTWDGTDEFGKETASGTYFVLR